MLKNDCNAPLHPAARHGLELFNAGEYFEAHEYLETAWRAERGPVRTLYQGILQVAVAYLHTQRGNYVGAIALSERARNKLEGWPENCRGVHVGTLLDDLSLVTETLVRLGPQGIAAFDPRLFKPVKFDG